VLGGTYLTRLTLPGADRSVVVGARRDDERRQWTVVLFPSREAGDAPSARMTLAPGEETAVGDLRVRFADLAALPAAVRRDVPLPATVAARDAALRGPLLLQMSNAVFGSSEASSGRAIAVPAGDGPPTLSISGLSTGALSLTPGQSTTVEGYRYTFAGQLPFAGIQVKRDRGAAFMWVAVALLVAGLAITFHVPRRRLWATITPERTLIAGIAGPLVDFSRELRRLGAEAGAPDALADDEGEEP
jgi:cytochrome c biogenesis protein ResB